MKWYYVFLKSLREQIRDYWILVLTLVFAPLFVFLYYLMSETENPVYKIVFVNQDKTVAFMGKENNLGDTLINYLSLIAENEDDVLLSYSETGSREEGLLMLSAGKADVMVVLPEDLSRSIVSPEISAIGNAGAGGLVQGDTGLGDAVRGETNPEKSILELVGDITDLNYIIGAIWTEELINRFILESADLRLPFEWRETSLGHSGTRSEFELYVPGLMIFSIIMMMFTASASIVREPEAGTLERLKISNLTALEYLSGISLIQVIIGLISLLLTILCAISLGYEVIPGTFGFIIWIGFLTSLSMISFSLIVAAMCRSIKDVAIIGTFPLMILMFFSGAFFPLGGGEILSLGNFTLHLNDLLSPTWAVEALNKVLIKGLNTHDALTEMFAIITLSVIYFLIGVWAFQRRHMKAS